MAERTVEKLEAGAKSALKAAKRAGATQAAVRVGRSKYTAVTFRRGELEKAKAATKQWLAIRLFVAGRFGVFTTSDLRADALSGFVRQAVKLTRAIESDPLRSLPDPARYAKFPAKDLGTYDPALAAAPVDEWTNRAGRMDKLAGQTAAGQKAAVVSTLGYASASVDKSILADSNGFAGHLRGSSCDAGAVIVLSDSRQKGKRRQGWWGTQSITLKGLGDAKTDQRVVDKTLDRTLRQMNARPGPSGRTAVVVENAVAGKLVGALLGPISGPSLKQRTSYLLGKLGKKIGAESLTIKDEPHIKGGFGSRWFDGEGVAAETMPIIEAGRLRNYFLSTYYARALKLEPTIASPSNVTFTPTINKGFDRLISGLKKGLAITGFLGGNFNSTTGDFSYGVSGLWIENGRPIHAVEGMNMSGNYNDLWASLMAVGNDPYPYSSRLTPSLMFDQVQLSGV